jgi:hypothetical protein
MKVYKYVLLNVTCRSRFKSSETPCKTCKLDGQCLLTAETGMRIRTERILPCKLLLSLSRLIVFFLNYCCHVLR